MTDNKKISLTYGRKFIPVLDTQAPGQNQARNNLASRFLNWVTDGPLVEFF